jgi:hypothetical protein
MRFELGLLKDKDEGELTDAFNLLAPEFGI